MLIPSHSFFTLGPLPSSLSLSVPTLSSHNYLLRSLALPLSPRFILFRLALSLTQLSGLSVRSSSNCSDGWQLCTMAGNDRANDWEQRTPSKKDLQCSKRNWTNTPNRSHPAQKRSQRALQKKPNNATKRSQRAQQKKPTSTTKEANYIFLMESFSSMFTMCLHHAGGSHVRFGPIKSTADHRSHQS